MAQRRVLPYSFHSFISTVCLDGNSVCSTISLSLTVMAGTKTLQNNPALHWSYSEKCTPTLTTACLQPFLQKALLHCAETGNLKAAVSQEHRERNYETYNLFWKDFEKIDDFSSFAVFSSSLEIRNIHSDSVVFPLTASVSLLK